MDQLLNAAREIGILENRELHLEDRRFLVPNRRLDARANLSQTLLRPFDRLRETLELRRNPVVGNDAMRDVGNLPAQQLDGTDCDSRRRSDSDELSFQIMISVMSS